MKKTSWLKVLLSFLVVAALSACQTIESDKVQQPKTTESAQNQARPEYLPADFPLPQDAKISTSNSVLNDGKKSVLLVFSTHESMSDVTKLYKDYFKTQNLDESSQTIDDKNIIIQGENTEKNESWSMIGGVLSSSEGFIELTVTWSEM
ncbi:hypothetical protein D3C78_1119110 [compost metagenome]